MRTWMLFVMLFPFASFAQSTSPWLKIGETTIGSVTAPAPGADYMNVYIRAASAYQHSNWWTNLVEKNRQAVLTIDLSATIAGVHATKSIAGKPIDLRSNKSMVDLGYSGVVIDHLPTTFSDASLSVAIDKSSKDGLNDLITMVSSLSQAQPPAISVSQQAIGMANFAKSLLDYLLNKNLLVQVVRSQSALPTGSMLPPGLYVCFAGDTAADYQQYVSAAKGSITWNGATLAFNNNAISNVSYFIIEVGYVTRFFANPTDSLSFGATKSWAALYLLADAEVPAINNATEATKSHNDIQSHLSDARTLLNGDFDFIQAEKDDIAAAVYNRINTAYVARLSSLGLDTTSGRTNWPTEAANNVPNTPENVAPPAVTQPNAPAAPPTLLRTLDPSSDAHDLELQSIQRSNRNVEATSQF